MPASESAFQSHSCHPAPHFCHPEPHFVIPSEVEGSPPKTPPLSEGTLPINSSPPEGFFSQLLPSPRGGGRRPEGSLPSESPAHESALEALRWHIAVPTSPFFGLGPHNNPPWTHPGGRLACQPFGKPAENQRPTRQLPVVLRHPLQGVGSAPHCRNTPPEMPGVLRSHPLGTCSVAHRRNTCWHLNH